MIPLLRRMLNLDKLDLVIDIAHDQVDVIRAQKEIIGMQQADIQQLNLIHARSVRDLIEQFLIAWETPECDIRDELIKGLQDMNDQVARLEEHTPS